MFAYEEAFSRNLGWVTPVEQAILRSKRVAIAGLGGVGGAHLITLVRLGIGSFHIADFDTFDIANFNRQAGATVSSLGRPKADVLLEMARDINPELRIEVFPDGITAENLSRFLDGVDVYVDGLDFFAFDSRSAVFAACAARGIPASTAAPLGMGVALLNFMPGGMTFEQYFRWNGQSEEEKALRFLLGLAPAGLHRSYLMDASRINLGEKRGPSTAMACQLCAGVVGVETLKILLKRGKVATAPWGMSFDAYGYRMAKTWRPGGNNHPLQRFALFVARRKMAAGGAKSAIPTQSAPGPGRSEIEGILDLAKWAPSGDNTQPWRFEILSDRHVAVHGFDTREYCVYDLNGRPSWIALGALIENIRLAASERAMHASAVRRENAPDNRPVFDITFEEDRSIRPDPLASQILERRVQRRAMRFRPLSPAEKEQLEQALGPSHRIVWLEGFRTKIRVVRLLWASAGLRLTIPEAHRVHIQVIQWNARFSEDRIPDAAVGTDPLTTRLMAWVMQSWERVEFFNRYLAGTIAPRLQLDVVPGLACAAHFVLVADKPPAGIDDYVDAGSAMQRFWLTATRLGLLVQPEMTPLIFSNYAHEKVEFSRSPHASPTARKVLGDLEELIGPDMRARAVFMGRIGAGKPPLPRSIRLPLGRLMYRESA